MDKHTNELQPGDVVVVKRGKGAFAAPDGRVVRYRYDGYRPDLGMFLTVERVDLAGGEGLAVSFTDGSVAFAQPTRCAWYVRRT